MVEVICCAVGSHSSLFHVPDTCGIWTDSDIRSHIDHYPEKKIPVLGVSGAAELTPLTNVVHSAP